MITFKHIKMEGFGSFLKPFLYVLEGPGMHIISGKNGSGKTTIFSALCWCIFDKALKSRDVMPWVKGKDFKGTVVVVEFLKDKVPYKIIRKKAGKRNEVLFYENNICLQNLRDKKDVQQAIERVLGVSFNLFKSSIIFGQNLTRLMRETGPKQKEIFDEAFEVIYINEAKIKASKELSVIQKQNEEFISKLDNLKNLVESEKRTYEAYKEQKEKTKEGIQELEEEVKELSEKIRTARADKKGKEELELQALQVDKKILKLSRLEDKHFKLDFTHEQNKAVTEEVKSNCKLLINNLSKHSTICTRCGTVITPANQGKHKAELRVELKANQKRLSKLIKRDEKNQARLVILSSSIEKLKKYRIIHKELLKKLGGEKYNEGLKDEYKAARLKNEEKLKNLKAELLVINRKLDKREKHQNKLIAKIADLSIKQKKTERSENLHRWLIDDPLSNKGIKAFIFDSMLGEINKKLAHYGSYTGNTIEFSIDLNSGNKNFEAVIRDGELIKPYDSMSGGEQQLIDICLAFSIHDIMTQNKNFNILLMDEIFESLDVDNVELVSELLSIKAKHSAIHIVTHQNMIFGQVVSQLTLKKTSKGSLAV